MNVDPFFDKDTATFTYVVSDPASRKCAIIDSVMDYDMYAGRTSTKAADRIIEHVKAHSLDVQWILETHAHADHLTASRYLQRELGGQIGIGVHIKDVFDVWVPIFNTAHDTKLEQGAFDHLFYDGEHFQIGTLNVRVMHTPGHTPACVSYLIGDAAFVGDTLFMPYMGTARADFPGGSAHILFNSIGKLLALPDATRLYVCHDYPPEGQDSACVSTVAEQRAFNKMVHEGISEEEYIAMRTARDETLSVPRLILPSIQVNLRAGEFGAPEDNGVQYIKIPINKI